MRTIVKAIIFLAVCVVIGLTIASQLNQHAVPTPIVSQTP